MKYLGIDGGGSKTSFLLVDEDYNEVCRAQSGPSNYLSVGADAARGAITHGFSRLTEQPNIVCAGFASGLTQVKTHPKKLLPLQSKCFKTFFL